MEEDPSPFLLKELCYDESLFTTLENSFVSVINGNVVSQGNKFDSNKLTYSSSIFQLTNGSFSDLNSTYDQLTLLGSIILGCSNCFDSIIQNAKIT